MIFDYDCDYYQDERDDPSAPTCCELCYRYEICKAYFERKEVMVDASRE